MNKAIFKCDNIAYSTPEHKTLLKQINLSVDEGEFISIKGKPGSGKSTLFFILGLIVKPTSGTIKIYNTEPHLEGSGQITGLRNRTIGLVFEKSMLNQHLTISENVELPLKYLGYSHNQRKEKAYDILDHMGLYHKKHHLPARLTHFQQKISELARASVLNANIFIMDEPVKGMQIQEKEAYYNKIYDLSQNNKTIVLFQDNQDPEIAARTLLLANGLLSYDKLSKLIDN